MNMKAMDEFLEKRGFEVKRKYLPAERAYEFIISKGINHHRELFVYPATAHPAEKDKMQRVFLENLIGGYHKVFGRITPEELRKTRETVESILDVESFYPKFMIDYTAYCKADIDTTKELYALIERRINSMRNQRLPKIQKVIFNDPATIVFWADNTKTVVRAENEVFDPEKGLAMAISKKALGNKHDYYNVFTRWLKKHNKK